KTTNINGTPWRIPLAHCLDLAGIHLNASRCHNVAKECHTIQPKLALRELSIQLLAAKSLQHNPQMLLVLVDAPRINQYVVDEHDNKLVQERMKNPIHKVHKHGRGIAESEWHDYELIVAITGTKSSLRNIRLPDLQLMIARTQVDIRKDAGSSQLVEEILNARKGILVLDCKSIQFPIVNTHAHRSNVSAVFQKSLPQKRSDPGMFFIPCIIGNLKIERAMLDLGASINVMPRSIFNSLNLGPLKQTGVVIQLTDRSTTFPDGVVEDVLVKVNDLVFPADFYVLSMDDKSSNSTPILLGRPFLNTAQTRIDVRQGTLTMEFDGHIIKFNIFDAMKYPNACDDSVYMLDVIDPLAQEFMESYGR
ncbi:Unknown protein, partial [Striga hermonthica]